ncbi:MAG: hypothetical protein LBE71_02740 [Dysgonamonadaceae bacterium]|nr:hypothetical protein [Dysgonamonadaceae bacterium]
MKKQQKSTPAAKGTRVHRAVFLMNDEERQAIERHWSRYGITNRSNWYRSIILSHVLKVMEDDYPTLFSENEMRR